MMPFCFWVIPMAWPTAVAESATWLLTLERACTVLLNIVDYWVDEEEWLDIDVMLLLAYP